MPPTAMSHLPAAKSGSRLAQFVLTHSSFAPIAVASEVARSTSMPSYDPSGLRKLKGL